MNEKTYLGDGVYASFDGYMIELRANDPNHGPAVYLEPNVYAALVAYRDRCVGAAPSGSSPGGG